MSKAYELDCTTCGGPSTATRKDAKHCNPCRALKVLEFLRGKFKRNRKCRTCETAFRPASQKDLAYCGACELRQRSDTATRPLPCAFCRGPVAQWSLLHSVCTKCLKDPATQDHIVPMLRKQQKKRKAEFADRIPTAPNLREVPHD